MRFECPGCGSATPFVTAEGGKPVYCAQCGRGYRFIYGFYHRYLYFVFNHPLLTYFLLLVFAVVMARSFPGRLQLLYLVFYTVAYWIAIRWAQRSHRYLKQLPTGPHAAPPRTSPAPAQAPRPPDSAPVGFPAAPPRLPTGPRPSLLAVLVFLLNLALFPFALVLGTASLTAVNGLFLDLIDGLGGSAALTSFLARTDLGAFRTQLGIYAFGVLLVALFFLAVNILAFSFTRGRPGRGRELVIWAMVFWLVSTLLLGSPLVSGLHLTTTWAAQERDVGTGAEHAFALPDDPLLQWTALHAWASGASPSQALLYFHKVLRGEIPNPGRHAWIAGSLAMDLAARTIRIQADEWSAEEAAAHAGFVAQADQVCMEIIRVMRRDGAHRLGLTARRALLRLHGLPFELPRSEAVLAEEFLLAPQRSSYLRPDLVNFGGGRIAVHRTIQALLRTEDRIPSPRIGELWRAVRDQPQLAKRLIATFEERRDATDRHAILLATTCLTSPASKAIVPLLRTALEAQGTLRFRAIQALYGVYRHARLPRTLSRARRFYSPYRSVYASRRYDQPSYADTHRATAELWRAFLRPQ